MSVHHYESGLSLRLLREAAGLSVIELANESRVLRFALENAEAGATGFRVETYWSIADVLSRHLGRHVSLDEVIGRERPLDFQARAQARVDACSKANQSLADALELARYERDLARDAAGKACVQRESIRSSLREWADEINKACDFLPGEVTDPMPYGEMVRLLRSELDEVKQAYAELEEAKACRTPPEESAELVNALREACKSVLRDSFVETAAPKALVRELVDEVLSARMGRAELFTEFDESDSGRLLSLRSVIDDCCEGRLPPGLVDEGDYEAMVRELVRTLQNSRGHLANIIKARDEYARQVAAMNLEGERLRGELDGACLELKGARAELDAARKANKQLLELSAEKGARVRELEAQPVVVRELGKDEREKLWWRAWENSMHAFERDAADAYADLCIAAATKLPEGAVRWTAETPEVGLPGCYVGVLVPPALEPGTYTVHCVAVPKGDDGDE